MNATNQTYSRLGLILLALLTLGWGVNWPIMKVVLQDVPPLTFRSICMLGSSIGIFLLARIVGQQLKVPWQHWRKLFLLSLTNTAGWNLFAIYGVGLLPSGRAALLGYTMPLWSMLLSIWLLNDKMTPRKLTSLVLGMTGVFVLMSENLDSMSRSLLGVGFMLAAAATWGIGVVMLKRFALPIPAFAMTGWLMLISGIPITIAAIALEHDAWRPISLYPALGVIYNVFVAFMFCYWAWNRIVLMVPIAVSSLSSLAIPIVGVVSGTILLHESIGWREIVAAALILGAIRLVLGGAQRKAAATDSLSTPRSSQQ